VDVVKCLNLTVQAMKKNCEDEMLKEAFSEMFTGDTTFTFKWAEVSTLHKQQ
jgi:hypothetical protein